MLYIRCLFALGVTLAKLPEPKISYPTELYNKRKRH